MGTSFEFKCGGCGYSAEVSGGRDTGMVAVIRTKRCRACKSVVDVLIGRFGVDGPTGDPEYDKNLGVCPGCKSMDVVAWGRTRPCPRCDGRMESDPLGGTVLLWD